MKIQYPLALFLCLLLTKYHDYQSENRKSAVKSESFKSYKLVVKRGPFHYDSFVMSIGQIQYLRNKNQKHGVEKYNKSSPGKIDSMKALNLFREIEQKGFWKLKNHYKTTSSCTSELAVTLEKDKEAKTVICDDFERDCPDLIKYIDKKVVELEGNDLKRIYLPG